MKREKPFLTYDEQADMLISRGFKADREELIRKLERVGQFRGGAEEVIRKYIVKDLNRLDAVILLRTPKSASASASRGRSPSAPSRTLPDTSAPAPANGSGLVNVSIAPVGGVRIKLIFKGCRRARRGAPDGIKFLLV